MGRPAAADKESRAELLDAQLKAWFDMLAAQPMPSHLIRRLDMLTGQQVNGVKLKKPETR